VTDRSDRIAVAAFVVILVCVVVAGLALLFLDLDHEVRSALAGFIGGIIAVFAVGVARWYSTGGGDKDPPKLRRRRDE
jgi:hypothetical protein